jgi:aryl-alcohol dehydrogenase-like predicted oxidoreductase
MKTRKLGALGDSELCAGCTSISASYGSAADIQQGIQTIHSAHEKGVTFFDTVEVYGAYTDEKLVGEALASIRVQFIIATKFGFDLVGSEGLNGRPENIKRVADESLKRLKTDRIDLFYQHRFGPKVPIEEVAGAVKVLVAQGKVLHLGLSEASAATIRQAHVVQRVTAIQTEYSFMERDVERNGVLDVCEELGIGFVPWGPIGIGYLTAKLDAETPLDPNKDLRTGFDRFSPENLAATRSVLVLLKRLTEEKMATPAQIALAWLLAQKPWNIPIPGTRRIDHLVENLGAVDVVLTTADLDEMEVAVAKLTVHGGRMNADQMTIVDKAV